MSTKSIAILCGLLLVVAFAAGRFSAPEKLRVETRTVEVQAKTEDKKDAKSASVDLDRHRDVTQTVVVKPDGTRETTTRTITDNQVKRTANSAQEVATAEITSKDQATLKQSSRTSRIDVDLLVGSSWSRSTGLGPWVYGVHVSKQFLGPLSVGLWGLSTGVAGVGIGLQF